MKRMTEMNEMNAMTETHETHETPKLSPAGRPAGRSSYTRLAGRPAGINTDWPAGRARNSRPSSPCSHPAPKNECFVVAGCFIGASVKLIHQGKASSSAVSKDWRS